MSDMKPF